MIKLNLNNQKIHAVALSLALLIFFSHLGYYHTLLFSSETPVEIFVSETDLNDMMEEVKSLKKYVPNSVFVFSFHTKPQSSKLNYNPALLTRDLLAVDSPPPEWRIIH
jgi:hypothetical protein